MTWPQPEMPPNICAVCRGAIPESPVGRAANDDYSADHLHTTVEAGAALALVHWRCRGQQQLGMFA